MPNPTVGKGAPVTLGLHVFKYAVYLAAAGDIYATMPTVKLANSANPSGSWVRAPRLKGDKITWATTTPQLLDGRAGFANQLQWQAVKQAEDVKLTLDFDEADPIAQAILRGDTATIATDGNNVGYASYTYKTGFLYNCKVLLIGLDEKDNTQDHVYMGSASMVFQQKDAGDFDGLSAEVFAYDVSSTETFQHRRYDGTSNTPANPAVAAVTNPAATATGGVALGF